MAVCMLMMHRPILGDIDHCPLTGRLFSCISVIILLPNLFTTSCQRQKFCS